MVEDEGRVVDGGEERFGELGVLELLRKLGDDDVMEVVPRLHHLVIEPGVQSRCRRFTVNAVFTRCTTHTAQTRTGSVRFHARLVQLPVGEGIRGELARISLHQLRPQQLVEDRPTVPPIQAGVHPSQGQAFNSVRALHRAGEWCVWYLGGGPSGGNVRA